MEAARPSRIGIAGLGLIGGSLALALRQAWPDVALHGLDSDPAVRRAAIGRQVVDHMADSLADLLGRCDLVLLCQPTAAVVASLHSAAAQWPAGRGPVLCDVASVKAAVVQAAEALGPHRGRFVAAHPIAGKAAGGLDAAEAGLFRGRPVVLCPEASDADALALVRQMWQATGAVLRELPAADHDERYASLSHLPQLLTWAYLRTVQQETWRDSRAQWAGPGYESFTRLGRSNPGLWADIVIQNRQPLLTRLDRLASHLATLRRALEHGSTDELTAYFEQARAFPENAPG